MYLGPGIYEHYKGKLYYVLGLSMDSETNQVCVVYRPLYDTGWPGLMHRPKNTAGQDSFDDEISGNYVARNGLAHPRPLWRFSPRALFQDQQTTVNLTVQSPAPIKLPGG